MEVSLHNMKKVAGKPGAKSMWFCMLCLSDLTGQVTCVLGPLNATLLSYISLLQNIELHFRSPEHVKKVVTSATSKLESGNSPFYCEASRIVHTYLTVLLCTVCSCVWSGATLNMFTISTSVERSTRRYAFSLVSLTDL